ncbi:pum, partial [Symbiodinium necroappetens]
MAIKLDPMCAETYNKRGIVRQVLGREDFDMADKLSRDDLERSLKIKEPPYASEDLEVAKTLNNLASALDTRKDLSRERSLKIQKQYYLPEHPEYQKAKGLLDALDSLSDVCKELGDYPKAKELLERSLMIEDMALQSLRARLQARDVVRFDGGAEALERTMPAFVPGLPGLPSMMPVVLQPALLMPAMLSSVRAIPVVMVGLPVQQIESQIPPRELSPVGSGFSDDVAAATAFSEHASEDSSSTTSDFSESPVLGKVWQLSQRQKGCRKVQEAVDQACNDLRKQIAKELSGHVVAAALSPNANHVLQRLVATLRPHDCQPLIDELLQAGAATVLEVARHQYGCRVIQRLLEHCQQEQMEAVANILMSDALPLARHAYGSFVMQQLLRYGSRAQQHILCQSFKASIQELLSHQAASPVIAKALSHSSPEDQVSLARAAVGRRLADVAITRYGHEAVQRVLQVLVGEDFNAACAALRPRLAALWAARYGRLVVKSVPELHRLCAGMTRSEVRETRSRAIKAVKPWIQLLADRRQCPEVRKAMEVLLQETREEYESTLEMKTAKAEVVQELQDRASQQEWMLRQLADAVEILEDALLCTTTVPMDLELFFTDVLAQPVSEELRTRAVSCLRALARCGAAA